MPRKKQKNIKARPPDPATAEKYLLWMEGKLLYHEPQSHPEISSPSLFGDERPLELDVGCGTGEFVLALAGERPDANFVGVELHTKSLYRAVERADDELTNVKFIRADFRLLYPLLPDGRLRSVYLHFPDPGCKPRHERRRLFGEQFLERVHRALESRGTLSVMTDNEGYFFEMLALAEATEGWRKTHSERYLTGYETGPKSRFQRMWESRGRVPLRFKLEKI
jgi:tRNA (guanine-N7-)-methyltransferase